ncbi:MAG: glycosyltransferase family 4 protein [Eubacteriaceae bacterium]
MKVLIFSNMYPTEDKPQFGIYVYNQIKYLELMGYKFKIISIKSKGNKYIRYLSFFIRGFIYALVKGKEYRIVHAHYAFPPGLFALMHKIRYKSKMVVTIHGSDINKMPDISKIADTCINRVLNNSNSIICVSENLKRKINEKYQVEYEKIKIINMGINNKMFKKDNIELTRTQLNLPHKASIILFVGNFYQAKGVLDLIEAFKLSTIKNKLLILIGDDKVELKVYNLVKNINQENIHIISPVAQSVVAKYMNAADLFVLPSYSEGTNLVTLEAISTQTLTLVSDIDAFDYLGKDTVLKFEVGNVKSLKEGLEKAFYIKDTSKYINNGRLVVTNNSAEEKSKEVALIYKE